MALRVPRSGFLFGLTSVMGASSLCFAAEPGAPGPARVAIVDGKWQIGGEVTHRGSRAEGLLMNVRMVNATFEDTNDATRPKGFDAEANTAAFIEQIPEYVAHGVRAFTSEPPGRHADYEGAVNSAFEPDGSLRDAYLARVRRVIDAVRAPRRGRDSRLLLPAAGPGVTRRGRGARGCREHGALGPGKRVSKRGPGNRQRVRARRVRSRDCSNRPSGRQN